MISVYEDGLNTTAQEIEDYDINYLTLIGLLLQTEEIETNPKWVDVYGEDEIWEVNWPCILTVEVNIPHLAIGAVSLLLAPNGQLCVTEQNAAPLKFYFPYKS